MEIRRFLRRSLIFSAEGKNRSIFLRYLQKQIDVFKWQTETFFIIFSRRAEVVRRRFWSSILNPPDDFFSVVLLEDVLSRTEAASRILFLGKDPVTVTVTKF